MHSCVCGFILHDYAYYQFVVIVVVVVDCMFGLIVLTGFSPGFFQWVGAFN